MKINLSLESYLKNTPGILSLSVRDFLNENLSDAENILEYSRVNNSKAASIVDTFSGTGLGVGVRAA